NTIAAKPLFRIAMVTLAVLTAAALCAPAMAAQNHPLPLWKVTGPKGHVMYMAGSMHMLNKKAYPLPAAFDTAFKKSRQLVEEINLNKVKPLETRKLINEMASLPEGKTLADVMGKHWPDTQKLAKKAGIKLDSYM